jgi:hypothetical protein
MNPTHYAVHENRQWRKMRLPGFSRKVKPARTICMKVCADADARAFAIDVMVTCPDCLVLRDEILSQPKRKPLTIRRARELFRALKGAA